MKTMGKITKKIFCNSAPRKMTKMQSGIFLRSYQATFVEEKEEGHEAWCYQPILTHARGKMDLIDMQSIPDGPYRWIHSFDRFQTRHKGRLLGHSFKILQSLDHSQSTVLQQADNGQEFDRQHVIGEQGEE